MPAQMMPIETEILDGIPITEEHNHYFSYRILATEIKDIEKCRNVNVNLAKTKDVDNVSKVQNACNIDVKVEDQKEVVKIEDIPSDGNAQDQSNVKVKVEDRTTVKLFNSKKRQVKGQVTKMKLCSKDMAHKLICANRLQKCHNISKATKCGSDSVKQSLKKKQK